MMIEPTLDTVYSKSDDVVAREIAGELIIIPMVAGIGDMENEIYALDGSGQEIWQKIDGKKTVGQIIAELETAYDADPGEIKNDVLGLFREIGKRKFIIPAE